MAGTGIETAPDGCDYEATGWSCASTGFLWFSDSQRPASSEWPCPRCNTDEFLDRAWTRSFQRGLPSTCPCCGPGMGDRAWQAAIGAAKEANCARTQAWLSRHVAVPEARNVPTRFRADQVA